MYSRSVLMKTTPYPECNDTQEAVTSATNTSHQAAVLFQFMKESVLRLLENKTEIPTVFVPRQCAIYKRELLASNRDRDIET